MKMKYQKTCRRFIKNVSMYGYEFIGYFFKSIKKKKSFLTEYRPRISNDVKYF